MRQKILFYLLLPLLITISYLPFRFLYLLSDLLCFIFKDIIGYRKSTVINNLKMAFPNKSEKEIKNISDNFYTYFSDFILETIKLYSISAKKLKKHISFEDKSILEEHYKKGKSVILVLGHLGNWEWAGPGAGLDLPFVFQAIYKRLLNPYFDKLVLRLRSRLGPELLEMKSAPRNMLMDKNRITCTAFPMDQRPPPEYAYWTKFMNRDAGFFMGPEKIARKMGYPVIYAKVERVKRGFYKMHVLEITDNAGNMKEGEVIEAFVRQLEKDIELSPELYLWSHKRWKHDRPNASRHSKTNA
ncbi:MAG: lysophospholipid acyltransferase family protein [Cytophagales bacterium]